MSASQRQRSGARGFSLIEVLIVAAVVAILAAVALPDYGSYLMRTRRALARVALYQAAHWLERAATATGRYPDVADIPAGLLRVEGDLYRLDASFPDNGFLLRATPQGSQSGDRCGTLTLSNSGLRDISNVTLDVTADACWNR